MLITPRYIFSLKIFVPQLRTLYLFFSYRTWQAYEVLADGVGDTWGSRTALKALSGFQAGPAVLEAVQSKKTRVPPPRVTDRSAGNL